MGFMISDFEKQVGPQMPRRCSEIVILPTAAQGSFIIVREMNSKTSVLETFGH